MPHSYTKPLQILKASAGSGKTFSLTVRFLALLFSGKNKYRRIMAVTFTNKATAEMKDRILSVLLQFATGDWKNVSGYFEEIQGIYPDFSKEQIQKKAQNIYREILHDYGRLTITTIDKFVQQIIRSFTFELGIPTDYQVTLNLRSIVRDLSERLHHSLSENPELLDWIIERAKARINEGKAWNYQKELESLSFQIFSEDFKSFDDAVKGAESNPLFAAAQEKIKAIKNSFEKDIKTLFEKADQIFISVNPDINALKGKSKSPLLQLNKPFQTFLNYQVDKGTTIFDKIIDEESQWFSKDATDRDKTIYPSINPLLKQIATNFHSGIGAYQLALALNENLYYLRLLKEMSNLLSDYRVENHLLLISDATHLLEGITRGMEDNPSFIWEKAGNRYQHFLFDEFQDTSRSQWKNFKPLLKNALGEAQGNQIEHLIVGDVKQSIYRWRGGDWKILLREAQQSIGKDFVAVESLKTNYRSDAQIIEFNNYVFPFMAEWLQGHINNHIQEKVGDDFFQSFWKPNGYDNIIQEAYFDVKQEVPTGKNKHCGIVDWKVFEVSSNLHRTKQLQEAILKETANRIFRWIVEEKKYTPGQIGILVRKNKEAQALLSYLKKDLQERGLPNAYAVISGDALKLNDHPAIQLLIQTFRMLSSSENNRGLYLSQCAYLFQLLKGHEEISLKPSDWIKFGKSESESWGEILPTKICQEPESLLQLPLEELLEEVIAAYQLNKHEDSLPFLFALRDILAQFINSENTGLSAFLEFWDNQEDLSLPTSEENSAVQIMTVHKAKGLAFDAVLLPFLLWSFDGNPKTQVWANVQDTAFSLLQTVPLKYDKHLSNSLLKDQYYEEQLYCYMDALNTLYVAMTRPKKHLFLCLPGYNQSLPGSIIAGDALLAALEHYQLKNQKSLIFPEGEETESKKSASKKHNLGWQLSEFPIAHHLKKQLDLTTSNQLQRLDNDENIRTGIAVHELLSICHTTQDIEPTINKLVQEGWFSEKERPIIQRVAESVLSNKELQTLLNRPGIFLNERDVLDKEGNTHRPDKVLVHPSETIIIDFKFTGKENPKHIEQVRWYKTLFKEMGYPNVSGYLFYGFQGRMVEV